MVYKKPLEVYRKAWKKLMMRKVMLMRTVMGMIKRMMVIMRMVMTLLCEGVIIL